MKAVSKLICGAVLLLVLFSFTGCFGGVEVSDRTFAEAVGIDKTVSGYRISVLISETDGSENNEIKRKVSSAEGADVTAALKAVKKQVSDNLFLGHTKLLIIGGNINGDDRVLNFADKKEKLSPSVSVAYSQKGAENILNDLSESDTDISKLLKFSEKNGETVKINLTDALSDQNRYYASVMNKNQTGISFSGVYAINNDPYYISSADCRNINLINNKLKGFSMTIATLNNAFSADISKPRCSIRVNKDQENVTFKVFLNCTAEISGETEQNNIDSENLVKKQLESEIRKTLEYCKLKKIVLPELEKRAVLKYPELSALSHEQMEEIIENSEFEIKCNIKFE